MKNLLIGLSIFLSSFPLFSQTFDLSISTDTAFFSYQNEIKHLYAYLNNPSDDSIHVDIIRVVNNVQPNWANGMCADTVCYFISTDSIHVIIPPNGNVEFRPGFTLFNDTTSQVAESIYDMKNKTDPSGQIMTHGFYGINTNVISSSQDLVLKNQINIFPNPTSGIINIEDASVIKNIKIFNWKGQLVFEKRGDQKTIDISFLSQGNYLIAIDTELGKVIRKFIKL